MINKVNICVYISLAKIDQPKKKMHPKEKLGSVMDLPANSNILKLECKCGILQILWCGLLLCLTIFVGEMYIVKCKT